MSHTGIAAAGHVLAGLVGLLLAPYLACLLMILAPRFSLVGADPGEPTDTTYYGLDKI